MRIDDDRIRIFDGGAACVKFYAPRQLTGTRPILTGPTPTLRVARGLTEASRVFCEKVPLGRYGRFRPKLP
jgi:hypothetical protein